MSRLEELTRKHGYDPARRTETIAGRKPISDRQVAFVTKLLREQPETGGELVSLIEGHHGVRFVRDWKSADAMFVINTLAGK